MTKSAAACERSLSHQSMPSSSVEKATRAPAPGCAAVQAALTAAMIGASGTRLRSAGSVGDWPCLAEMMMAVLRVREAVFEVGSGRHRFSGPAVTLPPQ